MSTKLALVGFLAFLMLEGCSGHSGGGSNAAAGSSRRAAVQRFDVIWRGRATTASGTVLESLLIVSEDGRYFGNMQDPASHCATVARGSSNASRAALTGGGNFGEIDYTTVPAVEYDCSFSVVPSGEPSTVSGFKPI